VLLPMLRMGEWVVDNIEKMLCGDYVLLFIGPKRFNFLFALGTSRVLVAALIVIASSTT
jgi:hypothetical protein